MLIIHGHGSPSYTQAIGVVAGWRRRMPVGVVIAFLSIWPGIVFLKEKVDVTFHNFHENSLFLPKLQNWTKHLPQLLKPFILPS
jgi:hypothetical protein